MTKPTQILNCSSYSHFIKNQNPLFWALVCLSIKILILMSSYFWVEAQGRIPQLCSWDCGYYETIAKEGYALSLGTAHSNLAFFPAFPFLTKILSAWTGFSFAIQAVILNLVLFFVGTYLMLLWCQELKMGEAYYLPVLFFSLDRFTLWSHVPYTESLFFLCIISSFLILRRQSFGKWSLPVTMLIGGIASAVRIVGVSIVAGIGIARIKNYLKNPLTGALHLTLGLLGVIGFFAYLHFTRGAWNLSLMATANWQRTFSFLGLIDSLSLIYKSFYFPTVFVFTCGIYALLSKKLAIRFSVEEKLISYFLIFIPMASTVQISLTRYLSLFLIGYISISLLIINYKNTFWRILWILIMCLEVFWQFKLTVKFLRSEVFLWAA